MAFASLVALTLGQYASQVFADAPIAPSDFQAHTQRVQDIAYRISVANIAICTDHYPQTGLTFKSDRRSAADKPNIQHIFTVATGSDAEKLGLRRDDEMLGINGLDVANSPELFWQAWSTHASPLRLLIRRQGQSISLDLPIKMGCNILVMPKASKKLNASTSGNFISVYSAMIAFAENDNELAFIIAHEIAHAILKHSVAGNEKALRDSNLRSAMEKDADYLGVLLMANAGYEPKAAAHIHTRLGGKEGFFLKNLGMFRGPYLTTQKRAAFLDARAAEIAADSTKENAAVAKMVK